MALRCYRAPNSYARHWEHAVTTVNILITLLSVIGSLIAIWQLSIYLKDRDRLTWRVVERSMRSVIKSMQRVNYKPDLIIGVGRGGAIVAGMLAGNLGHVPLFVVDTELNRTTRIAKADIRFPDLMPDVSGKKVIVVVGELYSGEDLRSVVHFVESHGPGEIDTMSLFSHPACAITPDYLGKQTRRPLDAPWRMTDIYRTRRL
jgi:hypoxanthine phosphoribosyltransferase